MISAASGVVVKYFIEIYVQFWLRARRVLKYFRMQISRECFPNIDVFEHTCGNFRTRNNLLYPFVIIKANSVEHFSVGVTFCFFLFTIMCLPRDSTATV